jgi:hypothetical protein
MPGLFSTQELYKVAGENAKDGEPHEPGFVSWVHALSSPRTMALVEKRVKVQVGRQIHP